MTIFITNFTKDTEKIKNCDSGFYYMIVEVNNYTVFMGQTVFYISFNLKWV